MAFKGGDLNGKTSPPPSKSHTHRAFFLASMADGASHVSNALMSADTKATLAACRAMGATATEDEDGWTIVGGNLHAPGFVDAENSGTTMRIFAGICSMFDGESTITGDESLRKRPMGPLLKALESTGSTCTSKDGLPPVTIRGPNHGGKVSIDGGVSSQFITSLLMVSPMLENDSEVTVEGSMVSAPYLDVTAHMMRLFGASVRRDGNVFSIAGRTGYTPYDYMVPADFSSAAFPLVAGALGGSVTVTGMDLEDPQGDKAILGILEKMGCRVEWNGRSVAVTGPERLHGGEFDLNAIPDTLPILSIAAAAAEGDTRLTNVPQARIKETDRISCMRENLEILGVEADEEPDGLVIHGRGRINGGCVRGFGDHRIIMALAIASGAAENAIVIDDEKAAAVTFPTFFELAESIRRER